jgi:hypothetical protein
MATRRFEVLLTGVNDLLMHADDIGWRDGMVAWQADPENKRNSKAGDDRTPAWRWLGCAYNDGKHVGIPADNLMTTLREGGAKVPVPGKKNLTYKKQSQSGLLVNEILWPIVTSVGLIDWHEVWALREEDDFEAHVSKAEALGFELFVKAAKVGMSKHVRVRPRFRNWSASGTITVMDETITPQVLQMILDHAGKYCGIGDWRPSSPKSPGPWGTFVASVKEI